MKKLLCTLHKKAFCTRSFFPSLNMQSNLRITLDFFDINERSLFIEFARSNKGIKG